MRGPGEDPTPLPLMASPPKRPELIPVARERPWQQAAAYGRLPVPRRKRTSAGRTNVEQRRSASVPLTSASSPSPVPLKPPWALRGEVDRPVVKRASVSSWRLEDGNRRSSLDRFCPSPSVWEKADKGGRVRESMQSRASSIGDDGHLAKEVEDEGERGAARATAVGTRKVNFRDSNGLFVQERARVPGLRLAREAGVEHGETACPNEPKGKKNQKPKHPTAQEQGDIRALPPALEAPLVDYDRGTAPADAGVRELMQMGKGREWDSETYRESLAATRYKQRLLQFRQAQRGHEAYTQAEEAKWQRQGVGAVSELKPKDHILGVDKPPPPPNASQDSLRNLENAQGSGKGWGADGPDAGRGRGTRQAKRGGRLEGGVEGGALPAAKARAWCARKADAASDSGGFVVQEEEDALAALARKRAAAAEKRAAAAEEQEKEHARKQARLKARREKERARAEAEEEREQAEAARRDGRDAARRSIIARRLARMDREAGATLSAKAKEFNRKFFDRRLYAGFGVGAAVSLDDSKEAVTPRGMHLRNIGDILKDSDVVRTLGAMLDRAPATAASELSAAGPGAAKWGQLRRAILSLEDET